MPVLLPLLLTLAGHTGAASDSAAYWQQEVSYRIAASLDEPAGVLTGKVRITYVNHSPDTLHDFSVHQYLNAFRPGSRWAAADSAEGVERFQRLADPDHAFERITTSTIMGAALRPVYPYAPDSTIAHWTLPRALAPGDTLTADIEWQARPSTLPRRQGRAGRRFDFAQWYPKVVVYDRHGWQDHPLYPAGEFYGEFATYDVTLDLPADQVIGATGVAVAGDPGWERAKADAGLVVEYQRDWYARRWKVGKVEGSSAGCGVAAGRKCVRFYAEDVHHFAFSLNPEYVYEEGRYGAVVVRVLYLPEDRREWGGVAVQRTETALAWLDTLFGPFAWPQITNVHRIEGGGTEFPMMMMNGGAGLGLIVHEAGHNYTMGILANNEWREGWLDEGFTSFQSGWFAETRGAPPAYPGLDARLLPWDVDRWSEPIATQSERFRDFVTYNTMIYAKGQLFFEQLRYIVGDDTMRAILRAFYSRWKLKHVDEAAFRVVAEEVSGRDLGWLFGQWLHGTPLIDFELSAVDRRRLPDGRWRTTVTVKRRGDGWMPLEIGDGERIYARTTGQQEIERVELVTAERPGRLMLDPRQRGHDWNMLNNYEGQGFLGVGRGGVGKRERRIDNPTRETTRRDRRVSAMLPVAWLNDHAGVTVGLRGRGNYLGRYDRSLTLLTYGLREHGSWLPSLYQRITTPVAGFVPRTATSVAVWSVEGRAGATISLDRTLRRHLTFGPEAHAGADGVWMATTDLAPLDPLLWDDAGTVEIGPWASTVLRRGAAVLRARIDVRGGALYWLPGAGLRSPQRYDVEGFGRVTGAASVRAPGPLGVTLGARLFGGGYLGHSPPPRQRRIMVAGADPYATFTNPLLRSRGALLVRPGLHYHAPGDANLRAFRPDLGGRWAVSAGLEVLKPVLQPRRGVLRSASLMGFVDAGLVDTLAIGSAPPGRWYTALSDGGVGVVTRHVLGDLDWTMRVELPLMVNRPSGAADAREGDAWFAFRWQVSLEPSF